MIGNPPSEVRKLIGDIDHVEQESATRQLERVVRDKGTVIVDVRVANRGGHKLPTATA